MPEGSMGVGASGTCRFGVGSSRWDATSFRVPFRTPFGGGPRPETTTRPRRVCVAASRSLVSPVPSKR